MNYIRSCMFIFLACMGTAYAAADGVAVDGGWLTMRAVSLEIRPGSPLDFSALFPDQAGGVKAPVVIDPAGQFLIAGKPQRFLCAPMLLTPPYGGYPEKAIADRYAVQLRRAGYNLVRLMHIETTLMTERDADFSYDPVQLDRLHYFLAALKREGIYWMVDAMTSENGSYGGVSPHRWVKKHNLLVRVFSDSEAQQHWRTQVAKLLGAVNPYTGKSILQDDALFGLSLVNEGGLQFLSHVNKRIPAELKPQLVTWLKSRYPDPKAFEKVWQQSVDHLNAARIELPPSDERSARMEDVLTFFLQIQSQTTRWMEAHLRKLGYRGPVTADNNMPTTHMMRARADYRWVDMHFYHDEGFGFQPGARIRNDSGIAKGLPHVTGLAMSRISGKPYSVSEYGQPFWNEWRHEIVAVPAYASMHDWSAICQHASTAVDLTYAQSKGWKQSIIPYAVGLDPVARATETLAALIFRRGDVKVSSTFAEVDLPGGAMEASGRYWGVPRDVERTALVMRTQTRLADESGSKPARGAIASMYAQNESKVERKVDQLLTVFASKLTGSDRAETMAKTAVPGNRSNSSAGVYESVTGELRTDMKTQQFEVRTSRTEALVFAELKAPIRLGTLTVHSGDAPALVALTSLDGLPLERSKRMLLVAATDALNTDMLFTSSNRRELVKLGRLPARVKPIHLELEINDNAVPLRVQAMRQSGELVEPVATSKGDAGWKVAIDFGVLANGPTFFYYLQRD